MEGDQQESMATLAAMFPDVEQPVLEAVLHSAGDDAAQAVEVLLGMTDDQRNAPPTEGAVRAAQVAEDEELARQLQQQMLFEEEFNEQQLLYQQQQQVSQQRPANEASYQPNYPGANLGIAPHGDRASVYRPNAWGASAPPSQQPHDEGYSTVGDALYDAGSSVRESANSWWSWAVGDEGGDGPPRRREDSEHESHEMQPMRRVREDEPRGAASGYGNDDDASNAIRDRSATDAAEERVVHGDLGTSGVLSGGGGEVRRRTRHATGGGAAAGDYGGL